MSIQRSDGYFHELVLQKCYMPHCFRSEMLVAKRLPSALRKVFIVVLKRVPNPVAGRVG